MGMYTELSLNVRLKYDRELFQALCGMIGDLDYKRPEHRFFSMQRSNFFFHMGSAYFDTQPSVSIKLGHREKYEDLATIQLETTFNIKNYEGEIEAFLEYLSEYIISEGVIGYKHYEECSASSKISFFKGTEIEIEPAKFGERNKEF